MNILVLGGAGFLGANLARHLVAQPNHRVTVFDALEPHLQATTDNLRAIWEDIEFVRGDMRDETALAKAVQGKHVIYNCAAQTSHPMSIQYPLLDAEINCLGNLKLLEAVRLLNREAVIVYAGSSTVTGKAVHPVIDEDHPERPLDIYSANKGVAEKYHRIYHQMHDLKTICLRFANLYGPYGKGFPEFGFVNYFISLAWSNKAIRVFGAGGQTRNVTYVGDAIAAMVKAAEIDALFGQTLFAASEEHYAVGDIAERIVGTLGRGSIEHVEWPEDRKRMEVDDVRISSDRFRSLTGWSASHSFESGLAETRDILMRDEAVVLR